MDPPADIVVSEAVAAEPETTAAQQPRRRWWSSKWFQGGLSLALVAAIFAYLFPKLADYGEVWKSVKDMTGLELAVLGVFALWNLASYFPLLVAVQPDLRYREAAISSTASTAVSNTLPGGAAIGIGLTISMQRSWGYGIGEIARAGVISGIWNNFVKLGLPVVALACLAVTGEVGAGLATAAVIGTVVLIAAVVGFSLLLRSDRLARKMGLLAQKAIAPFRRWLHKRPLQAWDEAAARFRTDTTGLLRGRAIRITAFTILSHISLYLVLVASLRVVGVSNDEVSWVTILAAFAFVRLLSAVPLTPGGLGVVELGLTAALGSGQTDPTQNQIAAAVLIYRFLTWFVPIPLGIASWLFWRANKSWRDNVVRRRAATT